MKYYKLIYYTVGGDYETNEVLMNEPFFRQIQRAIAEGKEHIILEDRVIKRTSIKEIAPADEIVREYLSFGTPLEQMKIKGLSLGDTKQLEPSKEKPGFKKLL